MATYKVDLQDIRFVLRDQLRLGELTQHEPFTDYAWEDFDAILSEADKLSREVLYPAHAESDAVGSRLIDGQVRVPKSFHAAFHAYTKGGWNGASVSQEMGGQGLPHALSSALADITIAACPAFFFIPALAKSAAQVIERVGTPEQRDTYCRNMYSGKWGGTMCLTEPQAGSAVGDLKTGATRVPGEDYYLIKGQKIFISAGDQDITENVIHLVLARTPDAPPGIRGVSLFIVPRNRLDGTPNDVVVTAVEHKMGLHGSPTCSLSFGDDGECRGTIIGKEGEGIQHMFLMMNEARIAVGIQASSMSNWSYQASLAYAKERIQGVDVAAMKDPLAERVAIIKHPDVRRMLMTMKCYSEGIRSLMYTTAHLVDREIVATNPNEKQRYRHLVELLTPICKAYGSYRAFDAADLGIMVHGGYGYIRDYAVEGILRDVKIAAIYEGTNGIQALDLLGRKVAAKGGVMFMSFIQWLNEFVVAHKSNPTVGKLVDALERAKNTLVEVTMDLGRRSSQGDVYYPVLNASNYLELFGDVVLGRQLIDQAVVASGRMGDCSESDRRFYEGKIKSAEFYVAQHLPRVESLAAAIRSEDRSALEMPF